MKNNLSKLFSGSDIDLNYNYIEPKTSYNGAWMICFLESAHIINDPKSLVYGCFLLRVSTYTWFGLKITNHFSSANEVDICMYYTQG